MTAILLASGTKRRWSLASEARAAAVVEAAEFEDQAVAIVYALTDLATGEIRYVGSCSNGLAYRLTRHFYFAERGKQWAISQWLREVNYQVGLEILAVDPTDPHGLEYEWIHRLLAAGCSLTNYAGAPTTEAQKRAATEANNRRWSDPAQRELLAGRNRQGVTGMLGHSHSVETREKISALQKGVPKGSPSLETRRRMSEAAKRRRTAREGVVPS